MSENEKSIGQGDSEIVDDVQTEPESGQDEVEKSGPFNPEQINVYELNFDGS